ncbi:glycosyltransferase family 4 protein [Corynebacterium sp. A21]|uniref:glycosyltransferase family 4 protein n=1 Tax=Corynebacterium sp. A21 TaxID=3457318 RepID=UPI003FD5E8D3
MINPVFDLRNLSLLVSAATRLATEDPAGFLNKVAERVRTSENRILSKVPVGALARVSTSHSEARELIERGELSEGITLIESLGDKASRSEKHLAQRTRERLIQLQEVPPAGTGFIALDAEIRVLHVLTNSQPFTHSGYTVRSQNVLKSLQGAGVQVHAVTRVAYPVLVGKLPASETQHIDGVSYERLLPWFYPLSLQDRDDLAVKMIVKRARKFRATVLHTTTDFKNALVTSRAAAELGVPWVYEVRGELESTWLSRQPDKDAERAKQSEFFKLARNQENHCMYAASVVVALSEVSKAELVSRGIETAKIHVVPNAIDGDIIGRQFDRSAIRSELGLPDTPIIGTITSVVDYEGLNTLIESLKFLPTDVKVLIVGEGTARPGLEKLAENLGLNGRVIFTGRRSQETIWKWYAALDVFVVPRKDIPVCRTVTPIKPLMAQALGVPVVASDLPALREVTGELAEYVAAEDPDALAKAIRYQLIPAEDEITRESWMASRTWNANAQRYLEAYEALRG